MIRSSLKTFDPIKSIWPRINTDTSKTYTNKVNHLFGEGFYLFRCLFNQRLSVFIRGQLRLMNYDKYEAFDCQILSHPLDIRSFWAYPFNRNSMVFKSFSAFQSLAQKLLLFITEETQFSQRRWDYRLQEVIGAVQYNVVAGDTGH